MHVDSNEVMLSDNLTFHLHFSFCRSFLIKSWELMYLCASSMPPSKDIVAHLSEYVHNVAGAKIDPIVQILASNTLNALKGSMKAGPRLTIPAREEIEALLTGKKLRTIIFFLDETFEEITYDMTTTVADTVEVLAMTFSSAKSLALLAILFAKLF